MLEKTFQRGLQSDGEQWTQRRPTGSTGARSTFRTAFPGRTSGGLRSAAASCLFFCPFQRRVVYPSPATRSIIKGADHWVGVLLFVLFLVPWPSSQEELNSDFTSSMRAWPLAPSHTEKTLLRVLRWDPSFTATSIWGLTLQFALIHRMLSDVRQMEM